MPHAVDWNTWARPETWPEHGAVMVATIADLRAVELYPEEGARQPSAGPIERRVDWERSDDDLGGEAWNQWLVSTYEAISGYLFQEQRAVEKILTYDLPEALVAELLPEDHPRFGSLPVNSGHVDALGDILALIVGSRAIFGPRDPSDPIELLFEILRCGAMPCGFADGESPEVLLAFAPSWRDG